PSAGPALHRSRAMIFRLLLTSRIRARNGATYRHWTPPAGRPASSWLRIGRNAASVLPLPVGAQRRRFLPPFSAGQARRWAGAGAEKCETNQRRTGSLSWASAVAQDSGGPSNS